MTVARPQMKFEFNLGTLIPLAVMAITMAVAWGNLTGTVGNMESRLTKMESAATAADARVRSVETGQANMTARLDGIKDSLDELKEGQRDTNMILRGLSTRSP